MKKILSLVLLTTLLTATLFLMCCSNDNDNVTEPDFETGETIMWDYNHTLMFWPGPEDIRTGKVWINVDLFAKGSNPDCSLLINNQPVIINGIHTYTNGSHYFFQGFSAASALPINYEIIDGTKHYTGTYLLPGILSCTFPDFYLNNDYSFTWTIEDDPSLYLVDVNVDGEMGGDDFQTEYVRQLDGDLRTHTVNKSLWTGMTFVDFVLDFDAVNYLLKDSGKTLICGTRSSRYVWKKQIPLNRAELAGKIIRAIDKDIKNQ